MPPGVRVSDAQRTAATWMGEFAGAENLEPFGVKLDPSQFARQDAVTLVTTGATAGANEVQSVTINGSPTGGTYTLTYAGQTTAPIAYNANAAAIQAALEALSNIGVGDVAVTGSGPFSVTFQGTLAKTNVAQMTADGSGLTGGSSPSVAIATTTPGVPAATSVPLTAALSGDIPAETILDFGSGKTAKLSAKALKGATSLAVYAIAVTLANADTATYPGRTTEPKYIRSGTLIGRTYAERDASTPFGPAAHTDDEFFILAFPLDNVDANNSGTVWRRGRLVKENKLPDWATISGNSNLLAKLRAVYQCVKGAP